MDAVLKNRIVARMSEIDALPAEMRQLVHDFGWTVVKAFRDAGVTKAKTIVHLIRCVNEGSVEGKSRPMIFLDEAPKALAGNGLAVVPIEPTQEMIDASLAQVTGFNVIVSKPEKHRRRLRAAIEAGRQKIASRQT